jgi:hypothetical protein
VHLREKIVDNLPPPPPKLAQTVVLSAEDRYVMLNVSKGIRVEERDLLVYVERLQFGKTLPAKEFKWSDNRTHWATTIAFDEVMGVCTSAVCLGYWFTDQSSREAHEKYACHYSVGATRDADAFAALKKKIAGTMVVMVKK